MMRLNPSVMWLIGEHGCTKGGVKLALYVGRTRISKGWQFFFFAKSVQSLTTRDYVDFFMLLRHGQYSTLLVSLSLSSLVPSTSQTHIHSDLKSGSNRFFAIFGTVEADAKP